ncbi:hypothetical protein GOODEAATRI_027822 [Goodea atripinnis]|uniref:Uncharacterized protein n=1 Tax=Goodea atripinnis TaxID=208336 RepID=A0ABV0NYF5_9TELE
MKELNEVSLGSVSFTRYRGLGAGSYTSYSGETVEDDLQRERSATSLYETADMYTTCYMFILFDIYYVFCNYTRVARQRDFFRPYCKFMFLAGPSVSKLEMLCRGCSAVFAQWF